MTILNDLREEYIHTNGINLHTIISGSGKALVLLHGFPDFWYGWKNLIPELQKDFQLIIPDLRGYNTSDKPEGIQNYKIEILIEDVRGICEALKLDKIYLAGHDWGGIISWVLAERYPELVEKLIILNAPHPVIFQKTMKEDIQQKKASVYVMQFQKEGGEIFLFENDFFALKFSVFENTKNRKAFSKADKEKYKSAWSQPNAVKSAVNYYKAFVEPYQGTGKIDVPTLVIWGMKDDYLKPVQLEYLPEYVKKLKIVKSEKSSHWIMYDDPELVIMNIKEFLKK
ncbi:MAG: alpha/beta hydrolase [Candidatus Lokiarchaeota archaeon]|nr:alpha/beta hydrolase [Candidatus Lokiarchaeota archaeon]